jgi:dipeptidyl aminopeptidase/acylaminoacyl peptidase
MKRSSRILAASLAVIATSLGRQAIALPAPVLTGQDLFSLSRATDPEFRPDGGVLAYVRVANDIMTDTGRKSIWLIDTRSGAQTPLGTGEEDAFAPCWSPDGSRIAYTAVSRDGTAEIFVRWLGSGQSARVARLQRSPESVAWAPDGKRLAFVMSVPAETQTLGSPLAKPAGAAWAEPLKVITDVSYRADGVGELKSGHRHVFVVSADGGATRQITFGETDDAGPLSWSPDSSAILFTGRRDKGWELAGFRSAIYRVAVEGGEATRLTSQEGPDAEGEFSPDGRRIAYIGYDDHLRGYENARVYVMDADGGNRRVLAPSLDRSLANPHWAADGKSVYADYVDHGITKVAKLSLDGALTDVASGLGGPGLDLPYAGGDYAVSRDGAVAFTQGAPDEPPEIAIVRQGQVRRLTNLNGDLLGARALAKVEPLTVASPFDGHAVDAWIATPPGFDPSHKYPLILEIHGGPFASYGPVFSSDDQLYASAGYVVVYANPRGSTSTGEAFANGINHAYPGYDYDDLMGAVDAAIAKGFVDPDRLFVTGGSGGGVLTSWIVGKTHRFRAAVTQKPVVNWSSEVLTNDLYPWMARYWFGKMPWEDPAGYWARSPLSLVGNVTTPTLVIVGDQDLRTPDGESEQFYDALRLRGVPTGLVKVPGAFHDMAARPSHAAAKAAAILAWFARYDTAPMQTGSVKP